MKICYLIQTHKNPDQIYRLVATLKQFSPGSQIVINHDFGSCHLSDSRFQEFSEVHIIPSRGGRGNFALVQSYLDVVEWLLNHNSHFDWLINLSGQDYPIQPVSQLEACLAETPYDGFMLYFEVFSTESHWKIREGYTRYHYRYQTVIERLSERQKTILKPFKLFNYLQPFFRVNFSYGFTLGLKTKTPFTPEFRCYGGSYLGTLSRRCVEYLHQFIQDNPQIVDYYKGVANPDESFLHTILMNHSQLKIANDCQRYFDFSSTQNGHPRILSSEDFPAIAQSPAYFARKFDPAVDSAILDRIDEQLLGKLQAPPENSLAETVETSS